MLRPVYAQNKIYSRTKEASFRWIAESSGPRYVSRTVPTVSKLIFAHTLAWLQWHDFSGGDCNRAALCLIWWRLVACNPAFHQHWNVNRSVHFCMEVCMEVRMNGSPYEDCVHPIAYSKEIIGKSNWGRPAEESCWTKRVLANISTALPLRTSYITSLPSTNENMLGIELINMHLLICWLLPSTPSYHLPTTTFLPQPTTTFLPQWKNHNEKMLLKKNSVEKKN